MRLLVEGLVKSMIALKVCDDKEINVSDTDFRNKVIDSVSDYIRKNFDSVVSINKEYFDGEKYPYVATINIEL